jgi:hypothetical protein
LQVYADAPSRRRLFHFLRIDRLQAQARASRRTCALCHQRRLCAEVDPLGVGEGAYCLQECWPYILGMVHGERAAARTVRLLVDRELDRVFDPAALQTRGWPWYRCDGCGELAPRLTTRTALLEELHWSELGRDAHLCPDCQPKKAEVAA